ncbi:MAG TPA: complex I NDUFA9 subunit family protein [Alphaproteobacteria bacterium]|mgnify:CR=1 FL=1|nr:complex I NDUFA9 subunit family protein [Alphaproteobacteria bacterium]
MINLSGKTITLIGGTGFVGRALAEKLLSADARVIVLARNAERAKRLKTGGAIGQLTAVPGNALNDEDLLSVIAPADIVINLVGILAPSGRQTFSALQAELPGRIARMATETGTASVVHVSALGADLKSPSVYARTKAEGERALLRQFAQATVLQPSIIFGPGDSFFNRFGQMAMLAPALPLIGGGTSLMQPVYVGDVADAVLAALTTEEARGQIYQLGGPQTYSFAELMRFTLECVGRRRLLLPVPYSVASLPAAFAGLLPNPPLTLDQLKLLKVDNVCKKSVPGLADLGITPTAIEGVVPAYLMPFRPGGRFAK